MMLIGLDTAVYANETNCGITRYLIIRPQPLQLTHLILFINHMERMVPVSLISEVSELGIHLQYPFNELTNLAPFTETHFAEVPSPDDGLLDNYLYQLPSEQTWIHVPILSYNIPQGEFVISRQTQIEARNGHVGQFKELMIDSVTHQITHLVFQHGHLWERKREIVPASSIDRLEGDTIYLAIDKFDLLHV